jgi:hypothetical protein
MGEKSRDFSITEIAERKKKVNDLNIKYRKRGRRRPSNEKSAEQNLKKSSI